MAQGGSKLKKTAKPKREKKGVTKRGAKRIAPKQPALIKQRAMDKVTLIHLIDSDLICYLLIRN